MRGLWIVVVGYGLVSTAQAAPAEQDVAVAEYCLKQEVTGDTGTEKIKLGTFEMRVELERGKDTLISFWNTMPDSQQILEVNNVPTTIGNNGKHLFSFIDNWGNSGKGELVADDDKATIALDIVTPSADPMGRNVGRQYGEYTLPADACGQVSVQDNASR